MNVLGIYRAKRYSPAKSESDKTILDAVLDIYFDNGANVSLLQEEELLELPALPKADLYISMARSDEALLMLDGVAEKCLNKPDGIRICNHRRWMPLSDQQKSEFPQWVKRADGCAEEKNDVSLCYSKEDVDKVIVSFQKRNIKEWVTQPHYEGDLVKCYGVAGSAFFSYYYPTDTGQTKFGLEEFNGKAHHYPFSLEKLKDAFTAIAVEIGVPIYGGDAIITENGEIHLIDFNDWPSFSPCREKAAKAIYDVNKGI